MSFSMFPFRRQEAYISFKHIYQRLYIYFISVRLRTHGNVFLRFCIVSSNDPVVLDSVENSKQYKNAGKRFRVYGNVFLRFCIVYCRFANAFVYGITSFKSQVTNIEDIVIAFRFPNGKHSFEAVFGYFSKRQHSTVYNQVPLQ